MVVLGSNAEMLASSAGKMWWSWDLMLRCLLPLPEDVVVLGSSAGMLAPSAGKMWWSWDLMLGCLLPLPVRCGRLGI